MTTNLVSQYFMRWMLRKFTHALVRYCDANLCENWAGKRTWYHDGTWMGGGTNMECRNIETVLRITITGSVMSNRTLWERYFEEYLVTLRHTEAHTERARQ